MPSFKFMNAHFLDPRLSYEVLSRRFVAFQQKLDVKKSDADDDTRSEEDRHQRSG